MDIVASTTSTKCGAADVIKTVYIGSPTPNQGTVVNGPDELASYQSGAFSLSNTNFNSALSYQWTVFSNVFPNADQYFQIQNQGNSTSVITPDGNAPTGYYTAQVRVTNSCGYYPLQKTFYVKKGPPQIFAFSVFQIQPMETLMFRKIQ